MSFKRKRDEENDTDDDEPSFGRQILPVANLSEDFDGAPVDGLQYLFTVRRDARHLPHITRASNPYEVPECSPPSTLGLNASHPALPSADWRSIFETRYRNFRKNIQQPTIHVEITPQNDSRRFMPDKKERDRWWAYLEGRPDTEWNPPKKSKQSQAKRFGQGMRGFADEPEVENLYSRPHREPWHTNDEGEVEMALRVDPTESLPTPSGTPAPSENPPSSSTAIATGRTYEAREPSTFLLGLIDERMALHLLMYFTHWINLHMQDPNNPSSRVTDSHARWIFALLSRVDDFISADDTNLLRNLARACIALLKTLIQARSVPAEPGETQGKTGVTGDVMDEPSCWIIISAIVGIWAQRDLWADAEDMLAGLGS